MEPNRICRCGLGFGPELAKLTQADTGLSLFLEKVGEFFEVAASTLAPTYGVPGMIRTRFFSS